MPSITAAKISPSGNVLVLETDSAVTGVNPGIALLCNGITTSMANPVYQGEYPWCWFPLSEQKFAIVDDSDAAFTATGPGWSSMPVADTGQGVARFEAIHVTAGASDTATYHFSGLIPGTYRISAILGQLYGPDRTTHASYTVRDGSNVLATVAIDQTKEPSFDWAAGYRFMDLCGPAQPVTITGTTLTVTVANAAGSGLLVTDAIAVDYLCGRAAPLGASITLSAPAGAIQTAAGPTAAVANLPVTLATDADWMPFDRTAKHTMQVGYNKNRPGAGEVSLFYANRARERDAWQPAGGNDQITVDAHGELTAVTGHAISALTGYAFTGDEPWQLPMVKLPLTFTVAFKSAGSDTPDVTLADAGAGFGIGPRYLSFDAGSGQWILTQTVSPSTYAPLHFRLLSHTIALRTGSVITNVAWYEDTLPSTWSKYTHPIPFERLSGHGFATVRFLDSYQSNNSNIVEFADFPDPANVSVAISNTARSIAAQSIAPVDTSAADSDNALKWFGNSKYNGVVKVTTAQPHGFQLGQFISVTCSPDSYPASMAGYNLHFSGYRLAVPLTATTFLMVCQTDDNGGQYPGTAPLTLAAPQTPTMNLGLYTLGGVPFGDCVRLCKETGVGGWFNVPQSASDACVRAMAQALLAGTPAGMKHRIEYSNEPWNYVFVQNHYFQTMKVHNDWMRAQGQTTADPANELQWYTLRAGQVHQIFKDVFTAAGRGDDIVRVMGSQGGNPGVTAEIAAYAHRAKIAFDELAIGTYQGLGSWAVDATPAFDRLDVDGVIDVLACVALRGGWPGIFVWHRENLDRDTGGDFAAVKIVSYEGGWDDFSGNGSTRQVQRAHALLRHRRMRPLELAQLQHWESCGCTLHVKYSLDLTSAAQGTNGWIDFPRFDGPVGTGDGSDGQYDNRNPFDLTKIVSTTGKARREWAEMVAGIAPAPNLSAPAPAPTPTPDAPAPAPAPAPSRLQTHQRPAPAPTPASSPRARTGRCGADSGTSTGRTSTGPNPGACTSTHTSARPGTGTYSRARPSARARASQTEVHAARFHESGALCSRSAVGSGGRPRGGDPGAGRRAQGRTTFTAGGG
jgi:hypothetical protein